MFGRKKLRSAKLDTWVGRKTALKGNVEFSGALHVDGAIHGNVEAASDGGAILSISEHGSIRGNVHVPNVVINGVVTGDVYAEDYIELAANARIEGDVHYNLIEMERGAEVNGNLVHAVGAVASAMPAPSEPRTPGSSPAAGQPGPAAGSPGQDLGQDSGQDLERSARSD